jgi:S-formylglutathione hydrolase
MEKIPFLDKIDLTTRGLELDMHNTWQEVEIGSKRADVYVFPEITRPRFGILYLHGIGLETLRGNPHFTRLLDEQKLVCVCPHGQRSWWGDRICSEFDPHLTPENYLLAHVVPFFQKRWGLGPRSIGLTGISMGGQGALRLAFKHPELFPVVAGISAALDYHELHGQGTTLDDMYDSKEQCRQDTALMHIHPSHYPGHFFFCIDPEDEWFRGNDRLHEKLNALGVPHEIDFTTRAGGHSWDYFNHQAEGVIRFLVAGLEQESRRLL